MEHPLAMDVEAMRRAGYATVDALVARLADPEADPVLRRAGAADMRARLGGPPPEQPGEYGAVAAADIRVPGPDLLGAVPLLAGLPAAARRAVHARGVYRDVAAGEEVIRRWDADRFFYIVLAGRYDVFIDTRLIRSHGPGDHFGELAARDWGGGYGYARLATVRCAEPGRLLKLTTEDLAWLTDSQPAVKARIAATLAERLQNR